MVAPILIAGGIAAAGSIISGILQKDIADEARDAAAKGDRERLAYLKKLSDDIKSPNFDISKYSPEELKYIGSFSPQSYSVIEEKAPELLGRDTNSDAYKAQIGALETLRNLSQGGLSASDRAEFQDQQNQADTYNRGIQEAITRQMGNRGTPGLELVQRMVGAQQANQSQAAAGRDIVKQAQARKLQALMQGANLGQQIEGTNLDLQSKNAGIINAFNQRKQVNAQDIANRNVGTQNTANLRNLETQQQLAGQNTQNRNEAFKYNQTNKNNLAQQEYDNQIKKASIAAGAAPNTAPGIIQDARDRANVVSNVAGGIGTAAIAAMGELGKQKETPSQQSTNLGSDTADEDFWKRLRAKQGVQV